MTRRIESTPFVQPAQLARQIGIEMALETGHLEPILGEIEQVIVV